LRVAVVAACPFPAARGTPVRILRLSEALADRGHEVQVVTYPLGDAEAVPANVEVHRTPRLPWYRFEGPGPSPTKLLLLDPMLVHTLRTCLRRRPVDLIHAHHYEGLLVALLARPRDTPIVFDAHTLLGSELPTYGFRLPRALLATGGRWLDRALPARADHVIAVSGVIRDRLVAAAGLSAADVTVIGNGVEDHLLHHLPPSGGQSTRRTPILAYAGNLAAYQGVDLLLHALAEVRRQHPDIRLRLLTTDDFGPYRGLVDQLGIADAVEVVPTPFHSLPEALDGADLAINPRPQADGVPQKLLNYMALGLPVVSFDGAALDLVHGETGFRVDDGDAAALARAISACLERPDRAAEVGAKARAFARERYSWAASAARVEDVFRGLLTTGLSRMPAGARAVPN
jgi:glycosyltransferase involved in cell wall biosynthesis